jgi:hypothetical protein
MGVFNLLAQVQDAVPTTTSVDITPVTTSVPTTSSTGLAIFGGVWLLFYLIFVVLLVVAYWKIFVKAGEAGWKSIIPIWNVIILLKIIGRPWWWLLLMLIPFVNFVVAIIVAIDLGKAFGKDTVWSVLLLVLFSVVGYLILGFGDAKYAGPSVGSAPTPPTPVAR